MLLWSIFCPSECQAGPYSSERPPLHSLLSPVLAASLGLGKGPGFYLPVPDRSSTARRSSLGGRRTFWSSVTPQLTFLKLLFTGRGGRVITACDEWRGCSASMLSPAAAAGEGASMCLTWEGCPQCPPPPLVLPASLLWPLKREQSLQLKYLGVFFLFLWKSSLLGP